MSHCQTIYWDYKLSWDITVWEYNFACITLFYQSSVGHDFFIILKRHRCRSFILSTPDYSQCHKDGASKHIEQSPELF